MFYTQWLELPISRINLQGSKDVRVIEVRLVKEWRIAMGEASWNVQQELLYYYYIMEGISFS